MERISQRERYDRGGIGRWYWDYRDRTVMKLLGDGPILDAGCGEMITTRKIPGAIGMDLDQGDVRGSAYNIPFPSETFGTVLLLEVIEHLKRPGDAISEIRRVLKPGGKLIMLFPNDRVFKIARALYGRWADCVRDWGHIDEQNPMVWRIVLRMLGFRICRSRSIPFRFWPVSLHHVIVGEKC